MKRIVLTGGSGLIGTALHDSLDSDGHHLIQLVRRTPQHPHEVAWDPGAVLSPDVLAGADAVVNLNGASIGRLPWTPRYRRTLRESRLHATRTLATAIRTLGTDAPSFISGSAVGYYGDRPGEDLTETSSAGDTFLAELCVEWEEGAHAAGENARVALLRTAPVLHPQGVLKPMIALTRLGLGGRLGPGTQVWPWISLDDEVRAIRHIIDSDLSGPVNLSAPTPATATQIGRALAARLRRPFLVPAPSWALRLGLSRDAADSLLLSDAHVEPRALLADGFEFQHPTASEAIAAAID
ncbi:TIGR01777 family oxidoreductase [Microbacterium esteraromaticum]|nr:TIGR01777 family oxidoreductase [Microbacterium esteraromaticum]